MRIDEYITSYYRWGLLDQMYEIMIDWMKVMDSEILV